MSERINLAELRTREPGLIWTDEVEALVEAVEAAHAYIFAASMALPNSERHIQERAAEALSRFDFGEAQP